MKTIDRESVTGAQRIVVKLGSRVLVQKSGRPDTRRMREIVKQIARLRKEGREVVLVSSGAIGCGMQALRMKSRPGNLPDLQMAAAVGQTRLMAIYEKLFATEKLRIGQVLLTHADLNDRGRHLNARNTMMALLRNGVIPVVNENDVVAVDEIKFGDNDLLASLVALLIEADLLILLTTVDGFRATGKTGRTRRVSVLRSVTEKDLSMARGKGSHLSTGGMATKLQAADMVAKVNTAAVIANGRSPNIITRILNGEDLGTLIAARNETSASMAGRKRWIAFFHKARGALIVDDGARKAIEEKGKSLLPIGIRDVEGRFAAGAVVNIKTADGVSFARGLTDYSSEQTLKIKGCKTSEIAALLGTKDYDEVIHRDNMVVLEIGKGDKK